MRLRDLVGTLALATALGIGAGLAGCASSGDEAARSADEAARLAASADDPDRDERRERRRRTPSSY